jgi:hypothetical protein
LAQPLQQTPGQQQQLSMQMQPMQQVRLPRSTSLALSAFA